MGQPIVITGGADDSTADAAAAFAAGAAAATAQDAEQTAHAAAEVAVAAVEVAQEATDTAAAAAQAAGGIEARLDALEDRWDRLAEDVAAMLDQAEEGPDEDPTAPEPITATLAQVELPADDKPKPVKARRAGRTGWGSSAWFGGRA